VLADIHLQMTELYNALTGPAAVCQVPAALTSVTQLGLFQGMAIWLVGWNTLESE